MVGRKKRQRRVVAPKPQPKTTRADPVKLPAPETEVVSEPGEPVVMQRAFPAGVLEQPPRTGPAQVRVIRMTPVCPHCAPVRKKRGLPPSEVRRVGGNGPSLYYQCRGCADPETQAYTIFKVQRVVEG